MINNKHNYNQDIADNISGQSLHTSESKKVSDQINEKMNDKCSFPSDNVLKLKDHVMNMNQKSDYSITVSSLCMSNSTKIIASVNQGINEVCSR